ncbi:MAG: hypothetical protein IPK72_23725 [Candidatus Eisenbacteria bacterium]|nr:hypothetical protein [Candidatus Eisenbacteria bacterium]
MTSSPDALNTARSRAPRSSPTRRRARTIETLAGIFLVSLATGPFLVSILARSQEGWITTTAWPSVAIVPIFALGALLLTRAQVGGFRELCRHPLVPGILAGCFGVSISTLLTIDRAIVQVSAGPPFLLSAYSLALLSLVLLACRFGIQWRKAAPRDGVVDESRPHLVLDRPIDSSRLDRLHRAPFIDRLVRS